MKKTILPIIILCFTGAAAMSQNDYYFREHANFNKDIPTPEQFFGYPIGDHHTRYDRIVDYFMMLAEISDRAEFEVFGYTEELRPQIILTVSSPGNIDQIESIRKKHLALSEEIPGIKADAANTPLVIQLGYNVHGNEASGGEASLLTAYYLVASEDSEINNILENSIIFIEPVLNPDGRERFTSWVNLNKSYNPSADPADREHNEAWPGGRTNHYWFDLNRDWLPLSQVESRNRVDRYMLWKPNVITDHHEMGTNSTFFFEPTKKGSENPIITMENYKTLNNLFAESFAEALNRVGHYYDSGNSFDNSYPGYGSSYGDVHGGLALLFEQASTRGLMQETDIGYILKFKTGIMNQLTGALTTVRTAVSNRTMLNDYMTRFYADAQAEASRDPVKAYIYGDPDDRGRTAAFTDLLIRHGVEVFELSSNISFGGKVFTKGFSFVVPVKQAEYKMVRTIFETNLTFPDSIFYDASAWSIVHAYGLPYAGMTKLPDTGPRVSDSGIKVDAVPFSSYGYLFNWSEYYSPKMLSILLSKGVKAKAAWEPFKIETEAGIKEFGRGSILIPVPYQDIDAEKLHAIVTHAAEQSVIQVFAIGTGASTNGPWMGNGSFRSIDKPSVLMFTGDGISSSSAGTIWHLFDTRMNIVITRADLSRFNRINLGNYNTVIMPQGNYSSLTESEVQELSDWVSNGGNLIAMGSAINFLGSKKIINIELKQRENQGSGRIDYDMISAESGKHSIGGIYCNVDLDITNPLGFGYNNRSIITYRDNSIFLKLLEGSTSNVAVYSAEPVISGFITPESKNLLDGTVSMGTVSKGRGQITLFVDDPAFRGFWYGTNKLILNALFFGNRI